MQGAFEILVFVVVAVGVVVAAVAVASNGSAYEQIGRGGLSLDSDRARRPPEPRGGSATAAEREEEIRQMVRARSERRVRQGQPALDVEAEVAHLLRAASAPVQSGAARGGLADEVRQLVIARNARRERQGKAPLDVEAEVARQLHELGG